MGPPYSDGCSVFIIPETRNEKLRSFDDFEQMSGLWSGFWFKSFRKIVIYCTFDHWSEILSLSAGRPISQGVCPPLVVTNEKGEAVGEVVTILC